jgi:hypothetical protein
MKRSNVACLVGVALGFAACSGKEVASSGGPGLACGAGTVESNGVCVAVGPDGSILVDGGSDGPVILPDGAVGDGATQDGATTLDGSDAASQTPDACPVVQGTRFIPIYMDCDPKCVRYPSEATPCPQATCGPTVALSFAQHGLPFQFRTPDRPGVDPNCDTQCPGGQYVYGLGFQDNKNFGVAVSIKVDPPWEIIRGKQKPFCELAGDPPPTQCAIIPWPLLFGDDHIYVVTKDPNAPARNVLVDYASIQVCP